jgi:Ca2+-binding EF-hand superfamily protein
MAQIENEQIEQEIKEIFDYFDQDHSGSIDAEELKNCLKCLGENVVDEEVNDMIAAMDKDNSGTIDYREFLSEMKKRYEKRDVEKELKAVYERFVENNQAFITKEGILKVMNEIFKEGMTSEDADDMIKVVGGDKGYVTYEEFKKVMLEGVGQN